VAAGPFEELVFQHFRHIIEFFHEICSYQASLKTSQQSADNPKKHIILKYLPIAVTNLEWTIKKQSGARTQVKRSIPRLTIFKFNGILELKLQTSTHTGVL
jgi:hypothetical protein